MAPLRSAAFQRYYQYRLFYRYRTFIRKSILSDTEVSSENTFHTVEIFSNKSTIESSDTETNVGDNKNLIKEIKAYRKETNKIHQTSKNKISEATLDTAKYAYSQYYVPIQCSKSVYQSLSKDVCVTYCTILRKGGL